MSATKILWGQILVVFLIVLATTWGATQWSPGGSAFRRSSAALVRAVRLADLLSARLLLVVVFLRRLCARDLRRGRIIAASGGFISIAVAIGMSVWRAREAKNVETYGSARWARRKEVKAAGLLGPDGVVLGRSARLSAP
jgi:type IV secretion system protein VirD4